MSGEITTWSGDADDFDALYEWAGKSHRSSLRGTPAVDEHPFALAIYNGRDGWVEVPAGTKLTKSFLGIEVAADEEPAAPAEEEPKEPVKETKDAPDTGTIETKPALVEQPAPPAPPAKKATVPAAPAAAKQ